MKEEYLNKIRALYNSICGLQISDSSPFILQHYVKQILEQISELNAIDDSENYLHIYGCLSHTLNKEVGYVEYAYDKTLKRNAAKIRQKEYRQELENAIRQIHLDIFTLLIDRKEQ